MRNGLSCSESGKIGWKKSFEKRKKINDDILKKYQACPNFCQQCGKELDYKHRNNKFCSSSCAAIHNNHLRKVVNHCLFCGHEINKKKTYCNNQCQQNFQWKQIKEEILQNGCFNNGVNGEANRRLVKRFLIERDGHKCQICGNTEWMGQPIPLIVDHIDGNCENSSIDNFRLICGNCDMQTDTYKNKNHHKGRFWRIQRRNEGKSF
jgi:predicted nucleic acid-binding Zn ribbon protein